MRPEEVPVRIVYCHPVFGRSTVTADGKAGVLETGVPRMFADWPLADMTAPIVGRFRAELAEALREAKP